MTGGRLLGSRGASTLVVAPEDTARAFGSGNVPVFSTPRMVGLMEQAAVKAIAAHLDPGETSVGTRGDIAHLAATPVGMEVRAEARLVEVNGRVLKFEVVAYDAQEKIGEGTHERAIIDERRFLDRVARKASLT